MENTIIENERAQQIADKIISDMRSNKEALIEDSQKDDGTFFHSLIERNISEEECYTVQEFTETWNLDYEKSMILLFGKGLTSEIREVYIEITCY